MTMLCAVLFAGLVLALVWGADQRAQRLRGERGRLEREAADREAAALDDARRLHAETVAEIEACADAAQNEDLLRWLDRRSSGLKP